MLPVLNSCNDKVWKVPASNRFVNIITSGGILFDLSCVTAFTTIDLSPAFMFNFLGVVRIFIQYSVPFNPLHWYFVVGMK